jgi:anti-anti-sigma factor
MSLTVNFEEKPSGIFLIHPVGTIDTNTYKMLEEQVDTILQGAAKAIVFDMEYVNYLSSAGVRVILKAKKALKKRGGTVILIHLQPQIQRVFEILQALPSMKVFTSIEELDQYLDQIQRKMTDGVH